MPPEKLEHDALREIGEICSGSAAAAIAKFSGRRTIHETSQMHELPAQELAQALGMAGRGISGAAVRLSGGVRGALLLAFPEAVSRQVIEGLHEMTPGHRPEDDQTRSAMKELVNVATGAYLRMFHNMLDLDVDQNVPAQVGGGWAPMIKYTFLGTTPGAEHVWAVSSALDMGYDEQGHMFLLLDHSGLDLVLDAARKLMAA